MKIKKSISVLVIALLVALSFIPAITVEARAGLTIQIGFVVGYNSDQGHVEYQINGGGWEEVSESGSIDITQEVTSLKFKVVPAPYYTVNYDAENDPRLQDGGPGVSFAAGDMDEARALLEGEGYEAILDNNPETISLTGIAFREGGTEEEHAPVTIDITGPGLEYWNGDYPSRINFFINTPQGDDPEDANIKWGGAGNLSWKGDYTIDGVFVKNANGVSTINPVEITYDYDGSGVVTIPVGISNASTKITSFKVNGTDYANQCPQTDEKFLDALNGPRSIGFEITNVPYADHYDIVIVAQFDDLMGGFGWNYLPDETLSGDDREDCIAHGTLSFIQGEYNGMVFDSAAAWNGHRHNGVSQIFEWVDGDKNYQDERDAWGSAAFPRGAVITFKLIPDEGYQLISLFGDKDLEPQEEPGVYKITMTGGMNSHLMATFTEVGDVVNATAGAVKDGEVSNLQNTHGEGTMKLNVEDTEISGASRTGFEGKAEEEEATIEEYIDINLANTIYKATDNPEDAWDRQVENLEEPATIKLELEKSYAGKDIVIIHEDGDQYEVIPVTFDGDKTISFETSSFSNYAIATKEPEEDPEKEQEEPEEPKEDPEKCGYHIGTDDGKFALEFTDDKDVDFKLVVSDYLKLTDSELAEYGIPKDLFNEILSSIKSMVKPGDLLAVYEVKLIKDDREFDGAGPYTFKIKLTDELKKYKDFKLYNLNGFGEEGFTPKAAIQLKEEDGYLVATIDELGTYALSGVPKDSSESPEKSKTPGTGDETPLGIWTVLIGLSALGLRLGLRHEK